MLSDVLKQQAAIGEAMVKQAVSKYSATSKTANSIEGISGDTWLKILGREFIEAMETGRGPRKSSTDGGFKDGMLDYMKARGIGADLDEKKRENLAKFLVLKINKEGDRLHKSGQTRDVYSSVLGKFMEGLIKVVEKDQFEALQNKVTESLKGMK
jgi:hypothetical protein